MQSTGGDGPPAGLEIVEDDSYELGIRHPVNHGILVSLGPLPDLGCSREERRSLTNSVEIYRSITGPRSPNIFNRGRIRTRPQGKKE